MSTPAQQVYPFDARPLVEPVDRRAAAAFAAAMKKQTPRSGTQTVMWVLIVIAIVLIGAPLAITAVVGVVIALTSGDSLAGSGSLVAGGLFSLPMLIPLVIAALVIPLVVFSRRKQHETAYRLSRFAQANNMEYVHAVPNPPLPGMIFHQGSNRTASTLVRGRVPRFVEFGNHTYTTGSGDDRKTHSWGYVAVKLSVPLPNIVLDAVGNNTLGTNLPATFAKDQRLSLEGDFDSYFNLYCPRGYEADALYLFTPDIMARFIDHAAELDVEIIDDWMFLYRRQSMVTTDAATWAWLFSTVGALMTKFQQWERWRDDRLRQTMQAAPQHPVAPAAVGTPAAASPAIPAAPVALPFAPPAGMLTPPPGVALQGRRLKRGFPWVTVVIALVIGAVFVLPQFIAFITAVLAMR